MLFFLLALLLVGWQSPSKPYRVLLNIIMLAVATEMMQVFIDGRGALWVDVLIDVGGGSIPIVIHRYVRYRSFHFIHEVGHSRSLNQIDFTFDAKILG